MQELEDLTWDDHEGATSIPCQAVVAVVSSCCWLDYLVARSWPVCLMDSILL